MTVDWSIIDWKIMTIREAAEEELKQEELERATAHVKNLLELKKEATVAFELETERYKKKISGIDESIEKIESGDYSEVSKSIGTAGELVCTDGYISSNRSTGNVYLGSHNVKY